MTMEAIRSSVACPLPARGDSANENNGHNSEHKDCLTAQ
jgi:hypothetical protein